MKTLFRISLTVFCVLIPVGSMVAQRSTNLGQNAALRYWSAFAEMQDVPINAQQAKDLVAVVDGTAPYDDAKYADLVQKNRAALETMNRGTMIPNCDWGVDYALGSDAPVDYVRKALILGRLNVLYIFHLLHEGDKDRAVHTLAAGLRFSHDVANDGTLFATVVAKGLLVAHLRAVELALQNGGLSATQKSLLRDAVNQLGTYGFDWQANMKRELEIPQPGLNAQAVGALRQIIPVYLSTLNKPSTLSKLQRLISAAPPPVRRLIPSPRQVLNAKQDLTERLRQVRSLLQ